VTGSPPGKACAIGRFYEQILGLAVEEEAGRVAVRFESGRSGLPAQLLAFEEAADAPAADAYDVDEAAAVHIALYVRDEAAFVAAFERAEAAGIVYINPRFEGGPPEFASARTLGEAVAYGQFRVKDCCDPATGRLGVVLEHEVRSPSHRAFPLGVAGSA